jgi:hypothetical protein
MRMVTDLLSKIGKYHFSAAKSQDPERLEVVVTHFGEGSYNVVRTGVEPAT